MVKHVMGVAPYPCIGSFRFLEITIYNSAAYPEILARLKSGDKYLDLACALGQDIRHLIFKGAIPSNLYGSDLRPEFFNLGYDLFFDRSTLKATFIASDIFDDTSALLRQLAGKLDIINAASFFHLFDWDSQVSVAKQVVKLLRPVSGSLLVGRHSGNVRPGKRDGSELRGPIYRHDTVSFRRLWEQVGRETGTEWEADITEEKWEDLQTHADSDEGAFKMQYVIRRV
ncbi:uncharacterized protein N7443_003200 [Penicillium atrosanguineum]|nr:uncharacterized protein N7443_003200 [Penicillium atrosanguineum]KAJ5118118.1 hypothetical protein N7526_011141 [Penicillium atrosanguineum]KAJ5310739.1 hypothetical protein N7443_003200 [Penicillium atrosanguineum]